MANVGCRMTELKGIPLLRRGKVRDVYDLGDKLLIVSTDRISCFDVVMATCVPDKGKILTQLSEFWFGFVKDIVEHHFLTADVKAFPSQLQPYAGILDGRSMLVKKAKVVPVECIVRGYLSGSGWKEYQKSGTVCDIRLPSGLQEFSRLPEPIFTPSTKEDVGHDINVSQAYVEKAVGVELATNLKKVSLGLYRKAASYAEKKGIIIADTKFEFGIYEGRLILVDEVLTPDSSRFWPKESYQPGRPQPSFDKQLVRDYLSALDWDKTPPGPELPVDLVQKTRENYLKALQLLSGKTLSGAACV